MTVHVHDWTGLGAVEPVVQVVLTEAARRVQEKGWVQGRFRDDAGAVDLLQALGDACGLDLTIACRRDVRLDVGPTVLLGAAIDRVRQRLDVEYLSRWNDEEGRTAAEVVAALEGACGCASVA